MIKLKTGISPKKGVSLNQEIIEFIKKKKSVPCKAKNRRPVFLIKYLEATHGRRDQTHRRQRFFASIELLRRAEKITGEKKESTGKLSFEIRGVTPSGETIRVHIREELEVKGRKLYLISTF